MSEDAPSPHTSSNTEPGQSPYSFQLTPYQDDGTFASSILFVQNQFKRHDVEALYQFIREVSSPIPLPTLEALQVKATENTVVYHKIDVGILHITLHYFEHIALNWDVVNYTTDYTAELLSSPLPTKRQRSPYILIVRIGDETYPPDIPLIPSLKAMLMAQVQAMGIPQEAFRYYDLFDHHLEWLTNFPTYRCKYPPATE